jgi:hypothetical protein
MHEWMHFSVGFILGLHPSRIELFPRQLDDGGWALGSVALITEKKPIRAMLAGLAPLLLLLPGYWLVVQSISQGMSVLAHATSLWLASLLLKNCVPSKTDFEVALPGLVITGALCLIISSVLQMY